MNSEKLLIRILYLIFLVFLLNYLAMIFHWYSSIWYFDMPMHFLGGFWLGLSAIYLFSLENSFKSIFKMFFIVLLVGIGWEVFEIIINNIITHDLFNLLDTVSDIFFDIAGGFSAVLYFLRYFHSQTMSIKENTL